MHTNLLRDFVHAHPLQEFVDAFFQNLLGSFKLNHAQAAIFRDHLLEVIDANVLHTSEFTNASFRIARAAQINHQALGISAYARVFSHLAATAFEYDIEHAFRSIIAVGSLYGSNCLRIFVFRNDRLLASAAKNHHVTLAEHLVAVFKLDRREHVCKFFGICKGLAARKNLGGIFLHILEHQGTHFAEAHNVHSAVFEVIESVLHLFHGQERNVAAELTQVGLGLDAFGGMNGTLKELVQGIPRCMQLVRRFVGAANLV